MKSFAAKCLVLSAVWFLGSNSLHAQNDIQRFRRSMAAEFHLSLARGPLRPVDQSLLTGPTASEILAGPTNGLESAYVVYTRMAPGTRPRGTYELPVEQTYEVLSGGLNVQIGTERFVAAPNTLVLIPPGIPHEVWNAGAEPETDLEVIGPATSRSLVAMVRPARPRQIANAAQYLHIPPSAREHVTGTPHGSVHQWPLANRSNGSKYIMERLSETPPGSGSKFAMIHPFDQIYFISRGTMTLQYGLYTYHAHANTLVLIPRGVVHRTANDGSSPLRVVELNIPQPASGTPFGVHVVLVRGQARPRT